MARSMTWSTGPNRHHPDRGSRCTTETWFWDKIRVVLIILSYLDR